MPRKKEQENSRLYSITVALTVTVMLAFTQSCSKEKKDFVPSFTDVGEVATVRSLDVLTLISDSGITRYRIKTQEWIMYDKAEDPYWYFPQRLYVEKFDSLLNAEAFIESDTAYFYTDRKLWKLVGNVEMKNIQQQHFTTSLLYWDQRKARIYSPAFIRIEQENQFLEGYGFDSNEQLTEYVIRRPGPGDFTPKQRVDSLSRVQSDTAVVDSQAINVAVP